MCINLIRPQINILDEKINVNIYQDIDFDINDKPASKRLTSRAHNRKSV